ncbi:MAG: hypothetical protein M2R45_04741 [Verrucomicrobia subdivision 3 bacterium]|nr:hypothetical protein [Limisphaerales bacterium]MCS1415761.1 hypothetical protein [Limisphaerales bacterium]
MGIVFGVLFDNLTIGLIVGLMIGTTVGARRYEQVRQPFGKERKFSPEDKGRT